MVQIGCDSMRFICPRCGNEMKHEYIKWYKNEQYSLYRVRCTPCQVSAEFKIHVKGIDEW